MAKTSLFKIAEQCRVITEKRVPIQVLVEAIKNCYGKIAVQQWHVNTQFDSTEVAGSFISTFTELVPEYDSDRDMYFITTPSSYLDLPHQMGVIWLSHLKERKSWVLVSNWGIFSGLKSAVMGGRGVYEIEGTKFWFPNITKQNCECPLLLKLAVALDDIDPEQELNIAPNVVNDIINLVVAPYMPKQNPIEKIREIIN